MADNNTVKPTQDILNRCELELCENKAAAGSVLIAETTEWHSSNMTTQFNVYCYDMTDKMVDTYCELERCYVIPVSKKKELISGRITSLIEKNEALGTKYKSLVKKIRELREKYVEAWDEACKIGVCMEDEQRCNDTIYKKFIKDKIIGRVSGLEGTIRTDYLNKVCRLVDSSIDIAGIQTFTNIKSLEPYCNTVKSYLEELQTDVSGNITSLETEYDSNKAAVSEAIQMQITAQVEKCDAEINKDTVTATFNYVGNSDCTDALDDGQETIKSICEKLKKSKVVSDEDDECQEIRDRIAAGNNATSAKANKANSSKTTTASARKSTSKQQKTDKGGNNKKTDA